MAEVLAKREIARLPVQRYEDVRRDLRSGDLVFCSGSYVFSGLIQRFTRSVWSHVGIVDRDEVRPVAGRRVRLREVGGEAQTRSRLDTVDFGVERVGPA